MTYELRAALPTDEDQLLDVARHLDTVNLPDDREAIRELLATSLASFNQTIADPRRREYVFVLVEVETNRIIGTSMILAQLGRRDAPYIFFDVLEEQKYSVSLDRHFTHTVLRIAYSYDGPTEIGGLVLIPEFRQSDARMGHFLSCARFLYLATHRALFREEILAELLPPLEPDGTSHLWEALGRKFTGMSYADADFLSKKNKEFIRQLFPDGVIYATVLSPPAQDVIGKVGAQTKGVEKLLRRIGFRYAHRVDPFDGGPHFTAMTDEITLVQRSRRSVLRSLLPDGTGRRGVIAVEEEAVEPFFRAVLGPMVDSATTGVHVGSAVAEQLGLRPGDEVLTLPLE